MDLDDPTRTEPATDPAASPGSRHDTPAPREGEPLRQDKYAVPTGRQPLTPIVKPLPPDLFVVHGSTAETRWESMRGQGLHTPNDRFFVRNHTGTPLIDAERWRLRLHGSGLREPLALTYGDLLSLGSATADVAIECAGNGRSLFASQQGTPAPGVPWRLGGVGVARWHGVPLRTVLELAGVTEDAVDVMPRGLDAPYVEDGVDHGRVRRPLPVAKAMDDVLIAFEMNGRTLPPDHGFPARLVVPGWSGIASIKWLGDIEVSTTPLTSPWNTRFYRLFGPGHAEGGDPLTVQGVRSAFELPWEATLPAGRQVLHGRSWSGRGRVVEVEVSADGGGTWARARARVPRRPGVWTRWEFAWTPPGPGAYVLMARATDETGARQPDAAAFNTLGYQFGGVVRHPVTVV
ncbi:sulfite oxidase [Sphaerisporangium krabiense]|uniref:DMSO/TMAO reductase YedYZ molybdopterin-dependent catalytic subunit n=1 Tax=Sphaerisporangium krabiense TaxID=763782 RepID=A0A7W9DTD1_9ACTN|nr:sulfite oxidase [Sphaerisporangium krabiense]MBB5630667.1 DMSO/TMAO reductase YedYZ molybdopterin-dependent catalytic subunit [Sphaerisporangium krabiense]GII62376.1 sulfite oxidase [Sphaerisporangium krabiense]